MCGVEEPLLPERRAVEDRAAQSEGAFETQEARHPRLHKTAGLRGLDVWAEISNYEVGNCRDHSSACCGTASICCIKRRTSWSTHTSSAVAEIPAVCRDLVAA